MRKKLLYILTISAMTMTLFSCNKSNSNVTVENDTETEVASEETKELIEEETEEVIEEEPKEEIEEEIEDTSDEVDDVDTKETTEDVPEEEITEKTSEENTSETTEKVEVAKESEPEPEQTVEPAKEEPTVSNEEKPKEEKKEEPKKEVVIPDSFDANFYASHNPDVVAAFGNSPEALYNHYKNYGKKEGRSQNSQEEAQKQANQQAQAQAQPQPTPQAEPQAPSQPPANESGSSGNSSITYTVDCDPGMLDLINQYRAENGLSALAWKSDCEQVAKDRIKAIGDGGVLSHDAAGGMPAGSVAENLFQGSGNYSSQFIFDGYKTSPGHNANMLHPTATSCVIATVSYYRNLGGLTTYAGQWNIQIYY